MRKLLLVLSLFVISNIAYGQEIKKGTLVGVHMFSDVKLAPGATMDQFVRAYNSKVIPAMEKARSGWKCYPIKRIRGDKSAEYGLMIVVPSEQERDKYFNADGSDNELGKATKKSVEPVLKELEKIGTIPNDRYIDWLVY